MGDTLPVVPSISIHALREEGDRNDMDTLLSTLAFLSTPSARRATRCCQCPQCTQPYFYPRPPRGGRRFTDGVSIAGEADFYPRPPRGGRHARELLQDRLQQISIHALREEGDHSS